MACGTLLVLMWKHLMVRKKRFIQTPLELLSPILFFVILYKFKDHINPTIPTFDVGNGTIDHTESIELSSFTPPKVIYYYPDTSHAGMLMEAVGESLGYSPLTHPPSPSDKWTKGYFAVQNMSSLASYAQNLRVEDAILILDNMLGPDWPKRLNYTIRMKIYMYTNTIEPLDDKHVPHLTYGTTYEPFMRLQWALFTSYIKLFTGNDIPQKVWVQEFPYYKTVEPNPVVKVVCAVLPMICWLSPLLAFVFLTSRLLTERTSGIQELIKMVGVSPVTLAVSHFLNVLPAALTFALAGSILLTVSSNPLIPNTSGGFIFVLLVLYIITIIAMAFACSYIARSTQYAVSISIMAYVALWMPMRLVTSYQIAGWLLLPLGLLPHVPVTWFWLQVAELEMYGSKVSFETMFTSHYEQTASVFVCYLLLILQAVLFFLLAWYLSHVRPGQYGQAKPWNFVCQREYWLKTKNEVQPRSSAAEEEEPITRDSKYFEEPPQNMNVGIKIVNVSKDYANKRVLNNVSLDVYKGEITVLLGHNGAGKTTLMSIITGMTSATEGKVYVNGMDTQTQMAAVRKHLGLCPQHNLFFADLTVLEHVMFFTLLKGGSFKEAGASSRELLKGLGLGGKLQASSGQLSGGMQRRLQLGCALAGGAALLVLDEPTSGLDVDTRRQLWDLLLSLRGGRTVLLTTHFMEEADALGDRVAALHQGRLRSYATPMFLKRAIGTGYRLTLTTSGAPNEAAISSAIGALVPDAALKEVTISSLSYSLPANSSANFPRLFTTLEAKRDELGIATIGVGVSTLEEVFLRLCSDTDTSHSEDSVDGFAPEPVFATVRGFPLYAQQFRILLKRQLRFILSKKISFFLLQILIPVVMICLFVKTMVNEGSSDSDAPSTVAMDLDLYKRMPTRRVLYSVPPTLANSIKHYPGVEFESTPNVADAILRTGQRDALEYNKYIAGIEIHDDTVKALFTTTVRHAAPVALGLLANVVAARYVPWADGRTLSAHVAPYDEPLARLRPPKDAMVMFMWAISVTFITLATLVNVCELPCSERVRGGRHRLVVAGAPPALLWGSTLVAHVASSVAVLVLAVALACATLEPDHTVDQPMFIVTAVVILLMGSMTFLALAYQVSFWFAERGTAVTLIFILIIFGFLTPSISSVSEALGEQPRGVLGALAGAGGLLAPPHALAAALARAGGAARLNGYCRLNRAQCPDLLVPEPGFDADKCCANQDPACYFCFEKSSPLKYIIILLVQFLVLMTTVILTEYGVFNSLYDRIRNIRYQPPAKYSQDEDIKAEAAYVQDVIQLPSKQIPDVMLISDVHKKYNPLFGKPCNAVKGISFSVKKGECFGLLGVNGAGKSTVFKMITAEECATRGALYANGYHLAKEKMSYLRSLSYCPQFSGTDPFLTGNENLALVLTLRGLRPQDVAKEVVSWIRLVGLEAHAARALGGYSGGCARRLAAAAALCAGAALVALDEPSAGVDVAARRRLWAAVRRAQPRAALLVSSHSMDEMEALCARVCVLARGRLRALGPAAGLRARHAAGHAVLLKVRAPPQADAVDGKSHLDRLKSELHQSFNCTLKDEHKTMLRYHINETMHYSELFETLEKLKATYPHLIEDYAITETTLEEVFLSLAESQEQVEAQP